MLFSDDESVSTLGKSEADFMEKVTDGHGDIAISRVKVAGDGKVEFLSGPLCSVGDRVRRINLHQRVAEVEVSLMERKTAVYFGIEIEK